MAFSIESSLLKLPRVVWVVVAALLGGGFGCGGPPATVRGTVTLDGKPLPAGTIGGVSFHPQDNGPVAVAPLGPNGEYSLQTGTDIGLAAGTYLVTVTATEPPTQPANPSAAPAAPRLITPARYSDKQQSGLQVQVQPGSNNIPLDLQSSP